MIIVHCSSQSISRSHDFSTHSSWMARRCTKMMTARNWLARIVYYNHEFEAHKNLSHRQFQIKVYYFMDYTVWTIQYSLYCNLLKIHWFTSNKVLELAHNEIQTLPEKLFEYNNELTRIRLDGNRLHSIPHQLFHGLFKVQSINLSRNFLNTVHRNAFQRKCDDS